MSGGLVHRFFWLLAALAHLQAVLRALAVTDASSAGADSWLRAFLMSIGVVFCILKVADLAILRVKPGWRPRLIAILALLLIHVGMMPGLHDTVADVWALGTMGTTALAWSRPLFVRLSDRLAWFCRDSHGFPFHHIARWLGDFFTPHIPVLIRSAVAPRAPPRC